MKHRVRAAVALAGLCITAMAPSAWGWDAAGHRMITMAALNGALRDGGVPSWLDTPEMRVRLEFQSAEADRWRGQPSAALKHENNPDHFLDIDDLELFDLSVRTVPPLRNEYLRAMILAKVAHPERFTDYDAAKDVAREYEWPGFVLHAIVEHYAKLQASFRTLRILEGLDEASRAQQIEQERANVVYHMGALSHFVGDTAQPLHTTRHHHGWVGENPNEYTTEWGFHAHIDGRVLVIHSITVDDILGQAKFERTVDVQSPWNDAVEQIERSFSHMETLYRMQKDGSLEEAPGKELIVSRLVDASEVLAAMYRGAWASSEPDGREVRMFEGWTPPPTPPATPEEAAPTGLRFKRN